MKIAVVTAGNIPSIMAHSINTVKHADAFLQLGHDTKLFSVQAYTDWKMLNTLKDGLNTFYGVSPGLEVRFFRDNLKYSLQKSGLESIYNLADKASFGLIKGFGDPEKNISQFVKEERFNLVYARAYRAVPYLLERGMSVIVESHASKLSRELRQVILLSGNEKFLGISTISPRNRDLFVEWGVPEHKIFVHEDAVDLRQFDAIVEPKDALRYKIGWPKDKTIITYCGSLWSGKGIKSLIKLAGIMKERTDLCFMVMGGPDTLRFKYQEESLKEGLDNIYFLGFVPNSQVPSYLKASDILVLFYSGDEKNSVMDIETTSPIKLFEYMASKRPVIATRIKRLEEIANDENLFFVGLDDIEGARKAIIDILTYKETALKKAESCYSLAQKYSYEERCSKMLDFFNINK